MKKINYFLLLLLSLCLSATAQGQLEMRKIKAAAPEDGSEVAQGFGYADRNVVGVQGVGNGNAGVLSGFIQISGVKDGKLNFVDVVMPDMTKDTKAAIAVLNSAGKVIFYETKTLETGLNHLVLNNPYTFTTNELHYVGYFVNATTKHPHIIGYDGSVNIAQASILGIHSSAPVLNSNVMQEIFDTSKQYSFGSLLIFAGIENAPKLENMAYLLGITTSLNVQPTENITPEILVRNLGTKAIKNLKLDVAIDGASKNVEATADLAAGQTGNVAFALTLPQKGKGEVAVKVLEVNGVANDFANIAATKPYLVLHEGGATKKKTVMIERFTTERCPNCPRVDPVFEKFVKAFEDAGLKVNVIMHHAGYYTDDFTITPSSALLPYLGVTFAPGFVIDRMALGEKGVCAFLPQYAMTEPLKELLLNQLEYGTIENVEAAYNDNKVVVKVSGTVADDFNEDLYITAAVTEDNLKAVSQAGATGTYIHHAVPRTFLSDAKGNKATVKDGRFEIEFPAKEIKSEWKKGDMKFVFMAHRVLNASTKTNYEQHQVLFSGTAPWEITNGINEVGVSEDAPRITSDNHRIVVDGAFNSVEIYGIDGKLVATSLNESLADGLYVVKVKTNNAKHTAKVMVK
ncbi:MAG: T9SS type A sorting domain-containing protein [Prevotella sp.]|nr:T9SS type A sorting domain-containing protein [Prevotellaceae bacterium]MDY3936485.1 T9SS type A sorting domain-containing protein [Prevotella sp.]